MKLYDIDVVVEIFIKKYSISISMVYKFDSAFYAVIIFY